MKRPIRGLHIAIALLAFCYLLLWGFGPWPDVPEAANFDSMTTEEFLRYASLDINSATREELMELPGIGENLAEAILEYRDAHGPFTSLEELKEVPGVGQKRLDEVKRYLRTG